MTEYEEKEVYVYLDFKGRLPAETFNTEVFFNIVNLNTKHPLVQLGQSVFYGTYEDCIGTNVFFEEDEESVPQTDAFSKKTPINLKYVAKQFKIINMQWAKVPEEAREDVSDDYDMKFKEDYESILKKIEEGAFRIEDLETKKESATAKQPAKTQENTTAAKSDQKPSDNKECVKLTKKTEKLQLKDVAVEKCSKNNLLKFIAREPLKRICTEGQCTIPDNLKVGYVYHSFKNKLFRESPFFDPLLVYYNQDTLEGAVDVNRCIRQGLINIPDINHQTKLALLNIQNFENLSLPMRYCVLRSQMKKQKRFINTATEKQIGQITEFGVNARDSYKIMKVIADDMKKRIVLKQALFEEMSKSIQDKESTNGKESQKKKKVIKKKKVVNA